MNPNDDCRDRILRFLYDRYQKAKGITAIPIGILDLRREMKNLYGMKQPEVASNLDYLIQVGWVKPAAVPERQRQASSRLLLVRPAGVDVLASSRGDLRELWADEP